MRIARHAASPEHAIELEREIARAAQGVRVEGRVCGAQCDARCGRCGSSQCQCACSPYCADAPRALTSDPAFPVEPLVAPLVFEMKRSGLFDPCWSCEGHNSPGGALHKAPTVWFYASLTSLRLFAGGLAKLRLHAPWRLALTHSDSDNPLPTFAIEAPREGYALAQLQADIAAIARALPGMLKDEARALQAQR